MIQILFLVAFFWDLGIVYLCFLRFLKRSSHDAVNSLKMQSYTSTNNSYPAPRKVLAELNEDVEGDMQGYMSVECDEI